MTTKSIEVPDSGRAQRLRVVAGACSVKGVRRDQNEDMQYVSPNMDLFIVADGMGGHAAGEIASKFAVDVLSHELVQIAANVPRVEVEVRVRAALDRAHCLIVDTAARTPAYHGAGTTVVLGLLLNHRLFITGVGDSRAYLIRDGVTERLTIDDTFPDAMYHLGKISADEARRHYMRNILTSALGTESFKAQQEEIRVLDVYHGDRYLLASDGLTDAVDDARLGAIISDNNDPQWAAEALVEEAVSSGAGDDITCVTFYVHGDLRRESLAIPRSYWQRVAAVLGRWWAPTGRRLTVSSPAL